MHIIDFGDMYSAGFIWNLARLNNIRPNYLLHSMVYISNPPTHHIHQPNPIKHIRFSATYKKQYSHVQFLLQQITHIIIKQISVQQEILIQIKSKS